MENVGPGMRWKGGVKIDMAFHDDNPPLFNKNDLQTVIEVQLKDIPAKIESYPRDKFLESSDEDLQEYFYSQVEISPLTLKEDEKDMPWPEETNVDVSADPMRVSSIFGESGPVYVPGVKVTISTPWEGDQELWKIKPNPLSTISSRGNIHTDASKDHGTLDIIIEQPLDQGKSEIKKIYGDNLESIKKVLEIQKPLIDQHNQNLSIEINKAIQKRRQNLKEIEGLSEFLNIPLRRRGEVPDINQIPLKRRVIKPLPKASHEGRKKDYRIPEEEYKHILELIRQFSRSFETNPNRMAVHGEEDLRDFILGILNIHYKDLATGETFRKSGKTDIIIPYENRAAFVAECKIWHGQKELYKGIKQLLGYLTWRDCKTSFVIFNKEKADFSTLQTTVEETFKKHPQCSEQLNCEHPGEWQFLFSLEGDPGRKIIIHVFLFDLHVSK